MSEPVDEGFVPLSHDEIVEIIRERMEESPKFADRLFQWLNAQDIVEPYEMGRVPIPALPSSFDRRER